MNFSKEELVAADKVVREWKKSGDIDLLSWINYKKRLPLDIPVFNSFGNKKQELAVDYWNDDETHTIIYSGSKGSGGTFLGISMLVIDAIKYPETIYFIARKKFADLQRFVRPSFEEALGSMEIATGTVVFDNPNQAYVFPNGSKIFLLSATYKLNDPRYQRFGSLMFTRGFIDAANEMEESAINVLADSVGRFGNPKGKVIMKVLVDRSNRYFYQKWKEFKSGTISPRFKFIQTVISDNKMLAAGYIDHLDKTLSFEDKQRLIFGNWDY